MGKPSGKFLVDFINSLSGQELFFGAWFVIVLTVIVGLINYQKRTQRRNFKETPYRKKSQSTAVVPTQSVQETKLTVNKRNQYPNKK